MKRTDKSTLKGMSVIITRPEHQADDLIHAVQRAGGRPIRFPTITITAANPKTITTIRRNMQQLKSDDWAIFVSANAVRFALDPMYDLFPPTAALRFAAVGDATAAALKEAGVGHVVTPAAGSGAEALLEAPELQRLSGLRCVIFKGSGGLVILGNSLRARGAAVCEACVYRRRQKRWERDALSAMLPKHDRLATVVTSGEILTHLVSSMDAATYERLQQAPLIAPGARLEELAKRSGFKKVVRAAGPGTGSLMAALARAATAR